MNAWLKPLAPGITALIRLDHSHVLATFHQFHADTARGKKQALVDSLCLALEVHTQLEEELFYPALQALSEPLKVVEKSFPEHAEVKRLIGVLRGMRAGDPSYDETFMELMRDVLHHVADEETTLLPAAERLLPWPQQAELGAEMTARRLKWLGPRARELTWATMRSLPESGLVMAAEAMAAGAQLFGRAAGPRGQ